jgi:hypothetical protein
MYLRQIASDTAAELWRVVRREANRARLVLPRYRSGKVRVSEQESRSIAQHLVSRGPFWYSIETPTPTRHNFTGIEGSIGRSAQHDLSLYLANDPATLIANIEFKQGHKSGKAGVQVIAKDLEKLLASGRHSLWFHSFPLPTTNELCMIRGFFLDAIKRVVSPATPVEGAQVVLAFCAVIDPVLWVAGPVPWAQVGSLLDRFPMATSRPHEAWTREVPNTPEPPPPSPLSFDDDDAS